MQTQKQNLPFAGLTLKMYSTGKQSPKFEFQASSTKSQFQCSLTKKLYRLDQIHEWLNSPQIQKYIQAGFVGKWGSKTQDGQATQWNNGKEQAIVFYMVKPYNTDGYNKPKPIAQSMPQNYQSYELTDDKLPDSEIEWAKESPTDFNPDQYEQELG